MSDQIREALVSTLEDVVGQFESGDRVFPLGFFPQGTVQVSGGNGDPGGGGGRSGYSLYVTYILIDSEHHRHLTKGAGLVEETYRITSWSTERPSVAYDIANAIREKLDNFRGQLGGGTAVVSVNAILLDDQSAGYQPFKESSPIHGWWVQQDFVFWRAESLSPVL